MRNRTIRLALLVAPLAAVLAAGTACSGGGAKPPSANATCVDMLTQVATCASDASFAQTYIDALAAELPELDAATRTQLVDGMRTRLTAGGDAEAQCAQLAAKGQVPPATELKAVLDAAGGNCGQLATGLGTAQGKLIRRMVEAPATGRPPR